MYTLLFDKYLFTNEVQRKEGKKKGDRRPSFFSSLLFSSLLFSSLLFSSLLFSSLLFSSLLFSSLLFSSLLFSSLLLSHLYYQYCWLYRTQVKPIETACFNVWPHILNHVNSVFYNVSGSIINIYIFMLEPSCPAYWLNCWLIYDFKSAD